MSNATDKMKLKLDRVAAAANREIDRIAAAEKRTADALGARLIKAGRRLKSAGK